MKARAVFLDLDGTLIDLNPDLDELEVLRETLLVRAREGGITPSTRSILGIYGQALSESGFDDPAARRMREDLDACEVRWAQERSSILPGASVLSRARSLGLTLGIVTSNGRAALEALFEAGRLEPGLFDFSVTRDESPSLKPSPDPLRLAWERAEKAAGRLAAGWFVGDSDADAEAAGALRRAGEDRLRFLRVHSPGSVPRGETLTEVLSRILA